RSHRRRAQPGRTGRGAGRCGVDLPSAACARRQPEGSARKFRKRSRV
ncbi:hypothetical protein XPN_0997, partial [Xanthomonas arboricola pv. pruni MAFF 301427]